MAVTSMNCGFQIILSSGSIQSGQIGNAAVNSGNIASGQIGADHLASGLLGSLSLSSGVITSGLIGNAAVVSGSIGSGQIGGFHVQSGFIYPGSNVTITVDSNNNYQISATVSGGVAVSTLTFSSGLALSSGSFFDGSVPMIAGIASGGIVAGMIGPNAVGSGSLASGSVNSSSIASGSINSTHLGSGSVTTTALASGSVTLDSLASGVQGSFVVASGSINSGSFAPSSVTSGVVSSGAVTPFNIASGLVYAGANVVVVVDGNNRYQVSASPSGSLSVLPLNVGSGLVLNSGNFFDGSSVKFIGIGSGGVVSGSIGNNAVTSGNIASGQITTQHFASGVLQSFFLTSGDVTSGFIGDAAVVSGSVASGALGYVHLNSGFVFNADLLVTLNSGKTFGRYDNGDLVPSSGKSALQVIELALSEPLPPSASGYSSTVIQFNQQSINNVLDFSYVIPVSGVTVASCDLSWRRNNTGVWNNLSTSAANPLTFTHTTINSAFDITPFNYRYRVTDSAANSTDVYVNITPQSYTPPTMNLSVVASTLFGPESNLERETGNTSSVLSGTIISNETFVNLQTLDIEYLLSGSWISTFGPVPLSGQATYTTPAVTTNDGALATASGTAYRLTYTDVYTSGSSTPVNVVFHNVIFYGPSSGVPATSAEVRQLSGAIFTTGPNPFNMNTGTTDANFAISMPSGQTLALVLDMTAASSDVTGNYSGNPFNVDNAAASATPYTTYTMSNAIPYSANHIQQITRA